MTETWDTEEMERILVNDEFLYGETRLEDADVVEGLVRALAKDYSPIADSGVDLDLINWDYLEKELA